MECGVVWNMQVVLAWNVGWWNIEHGMWTCGDGI